MVLELAGIRGLVPQAHLAYFILGFNLHTSLCFQHILKFHFYGLLLPLKYSPLSCTSGQRVNQVCNSQVRHLLCH